MAINRTRDKHKTLKPWLSSFFKVLDLKAIDLELANSLCMNEKALLKQQGSSHSDEDLILLAYLVIKLSQALTRGEVCIELTRVRAQLKSANININASAVNENYLCRLLTIHFVDVNNGLAVQRSNLENHQNPYNEIINYPLVMMQGRLYFSRYWFYQQQVHFAIQTRLQRKTEVYEQGQEIKKAERLSLTLQQLFPEQSAVGEVNWQMLAAANACLNRFSVITGGPGTGKTTTVTRLLAALISEQPSLRIALAAPTGKAAARLVESILAAKSELAKTFPLAEKIPVSSFTLHRLLAWRPDGFSYNHKKTLPYDLVIVDEASMVDLPMMAQLMEALADDAQLILLGDKDQLASVEAGSVLGDLCDSGVMVNGYPAHGLERHRAQQLEQLCGLTHSLQPYIEKNAPLMANSLSQLRVSYRFTSDSGIGKLAQAVNLGRSDLVSDSFSQFSDIQYYGHLSAPSYNRQVNRAGEWDKEQLNRAAETAWQQQVLTGYGYYLSAIKQGKSALEVLQLFNKFQLLCALRQGSSGLVALNERVVKLLQNHGLLNLDHFIQSSNTSSEQNRWYVGRPVMISRNDYELNLFNGDIGIAMEVEVEGRPESKELRVCFIASDHQTSETIIRRLLPTRLPQHETAFAMTVHKSQGSEFDDVGLVLPEKVSPVISRELIYTAITRGKKTFSLYANQEVLERGIQTRVERASGLRDLLFN